MKKAIFKGFAVAALALAVLFTGCKNESSNIETIKADAVEITAKAYPGYNYICWTPSEKYPTANITVVRDDGTVVSTAAAGAGTYVDVDIKDGVSYKYTAYVDTTGITVDFQYKYTSTATANIGNLEETTAYIKQGNSSSASCKAINPVCIKDGKLMTALELCEYEEGCDEDFVINADNIIFEYDEINNKYDVAFPTKEYLTYSPKLYKGNALDLFGLATASGTAFGTPVAAASGATNVPYIGNAEAQQKYYTNDTAVRYNGAITGAGEYTVVVEVSAKNPTYSTSRITAAKKVVIDALDVDTATGTPKAGYIDEGKTVRLIWTPAVKKDKTTKWAADSYKVYVKDSYDVYTEIAPAKVAQVDEEGEEVKDEDGNVIMDTTLAIAKGLQANEDVYYIDYTIPNNLITYTFYVVLSDNGKFESLSKVAYVDSYAEIGLATNVSSSSAVFANIDNNEVVDDAVLTLNISSNNGASAATRATVTAKYKTISLAANGSSYAGFDFDTDSTVGDSFSYSDSDIATLWLDTEFTDATITPNTDYTRFDAIVKDQPIDSFVVFLYKVSQPNKKDRYGYIITKDTTGNVAVSSLSPYNFSIASELDFDDAREDTTKDPSLTITLTPAKQDNFSAYTYELSYAKLSTAASTQTKNADYDNIASWTPVKLAAIAWDKDATPAKFLSKTEKVPLKVETPVYTYDADGKAKVASYRDEYVFKIVVTNKNAKGTDKGSKTYYTSVTEYTKAVTE